MTDTPTPPSFEHNLKALEQLISQLERNELPLEEALKAYARGTELVQACEGQLAQAEVTLTEISARAAKKSES